MKNDITSQLSQAIKKGDKNRIHTLRLILAAIKDKEIANRSSGEDSEISNESVIQLLKKMVKQRNDSIEMFAKANRNELVDKEKSEIAIIDEFLPQQLGEEETEILCNEKRYQIEYHIDSLDKILVSASITGGSPALMGTLPKSTNSMAPSCSATEVMISLILIACPEPIFTAPQKSEESSVTKHFATSSTNI